MTLKQRIFLISSIGILLGGVLVSYKSYELNRQFKIQSDNEKSVEISQWVAQAVEQKISHLESSVSYLDASTVETLKRMGARYFAYAHMKDGQWKIKWKVLGKLDRQGIIKEVNTISFKELPSTRRTWDFNQRGEHILISPVELSGSHQLKNGFLVFGLDESFFSFIGGVDKGVALISAEEKKVYSKNKINLKSFIDEIKDTANGKLFSQDGEAKILSSYFSKSSQLWVTRAEKFAAPSYFGSPIFSYFLLAIILSFGFLAIMVQRFILAIDIKAERSSKSISLPLASLFNSGIEKLSTYRAKAQSVTKRSGEEERPTVEKELNHEVIGDFSSFLDDVISLERSRLNKNKISILTQVEEGASILCAPQHITDFLRRLMENSIKALKSEEEKRIQIQLVDQAGDYQLLYVDTRRKFYPTQDRDSVFVQDESSIEHIDGLIAYGQWLFGDKMTVAKEGFCISLDLTRAEEKKVATPVVERVDDIEDFDRIEIRDEDTIGDLPFERIQSTASSKAEPVSHEIADDFSSQSLDDIVGSFEMKDFNFDDANKPEIKEDEEPVDDKGFFEFDTGEFKIKIRSPKTKKDNDVSR